LLTVPASTPGGIIEEARKHLRSEADDVNVEHIGDGETFTAGNNESLDFLKETTAELEQCTRERTSLKENVAHLNDKVADLEFSMTRVVERLRVVESQSEYRAMARMRFLSTFKRDYLPAEYDSTHPDSECIKEGNRQAHDPDRATPTFISTAIVQTKTLSKPYMELALSASML
jgi:hypothetical protein